MTRVSNWRRRIGHRLQRFGGLFLSEEQRLRWEVHRTHRFYSRLARKAEEAGDGNEVGDLYAEMSAVLAEPETQLEWLETRRWLKRAERYHVAPPDKRGAFWETNRAGAQVLTAAGKAEIHRGVREELTWRRERWKVLAPVVTALTGLIGAAIGLLALFKSLAAD